MDTRFLVPSLLHGELQQVKTKLAAVVRPAKSIHVIIEQLEASLIDAAEFQDLLVIDSKDSRAAVHGEHYWCDALMVELDRKQPFLDAAIVREWFLPLFNQQWGGLTFLSQEGVGPLFLPEARRSLVQWMLRNAASLERIATRFYLAGIGRVSFWEAPTNLTGCLAALGATPTDLLECRSAPACSALAQRLLAQPLTGG